MEKAKKLGLFSMILLGINSIIGSGIFLLPGKVYNLAGQNSMFIYIFATLLVLSILLCFAEVGSMFDKNGGAYLYSKKAFGDFIGFEVGTMSWVIRIISWSTLAVGFATALGSFWPESATEYKGYIAAILVTLLSINSLFGIKSTKIMNNVITIAKLVPLIVFIIVGIFFIKFVNIVPSGNVVNSSMGPAIILVFYAFTGFESFIVASGEMENPKKNLPVALITTIFICAIIYILIQIVCMGILGDRLFENSIPIADASSVFLGNYGKVFISVATLISIFGINIGSSIVTPKCGSARAEEGSLPAFIGKTNKYGAPYVAIIISLICCIPLVLTGSFEQLAVMSVIARFAQYIPTCLSVIVLRKRTDVKASFKIPFGPVIPMVAILGSLWLLQQAWAEDISKPITQNRVLIGLGAMLLIAPLYIFMKKNKEIEHKNKSEDSKLYISREKIQ